MAWIYLAVAGLLEIIWTVAMKQSHGLTRLVPSLVMLIGMIGSFGFLALAMRSLPLGTAYPLWTGIGAVGAFVVGFVVLGEQLTPMRVAAVLMIVSGIVTLKLAHG
ncbi:MAG: multidrug efflux SMR transporter [Pseudolabrys sp.]|nr:multidrug efflux SMR transporter [Pseudolabrys sp.]